MLNFFDLEQIAFEMWGYSMSYLELVGTLTGYLAIGLAARANVWNWPIGLVNVILFFFLFYQVQLYPDMLLQVFFFITNLIGWWRWTHPNRDEEDVNHELKISFMKRKHWVSLIIFGGLGTVLLGFLAGRFHLIFPQIFNIPSAFPFLDSFVTVMSILTTFLVVQKKIESWGIWIVVDLVAASLYFMKEIKFVGIQYGIYALMAAYGWWHWRKAYKSYSRPWHAMPPISESAGGGIHESI